ncbi:MAG: glycosyltransferase [Acidobacteria bacterium]|nr:glycosyltransferase [Acidobacteriota bacterium]
MKAAAFTIVAKNYLPFARVLMASLRACAPDVRRIVVLVDRPDGYFDRHGEDFEIILSEELDIPASRWFHFKYTILELSTAVKPYAAQHICARYEVDRLLYFDPDIHIYNDLQPLLKTLDEHTIVLTPHLTDPVEDERRPTDLDILRSGTYNLGFIGIRNCDESGRFLSWWQAKLYDHCVVDLAKGLFVDQRWVDLVPGMFRDVAILRGPEFNVAYWNIGQRHIAREPNGFRVNGRPLCFFHFSGFDPDNPHAFSRHQNRFTIEDLGDARELLLDYRRKLCDAGYAQCRAWPYAYGTFENGFQIPDIGRPAHHEAPELATRLSDPFSEEGYRAFLDIWNEPLSGPDGKPSGVTRLAYRIYRARTDVQLAMPDILNGDLLRFLNWVVSSGTREHNLSHAFVAPIALAVRTSQQGRVSPVGRTGRSDPVVNERIIETLRQRGVWVDNGAPIQVEALNQLIRDGDARLYLSQLSKAIYESRPDLQRFFPDPCGRDGLRFVAWYMTYGAREYHLSEILLSPLRTQWETVVASLKNPLLRLWHRSILRAMVGSVSVRARLGGVVARLNLARTVASMQVDGLRRGRAVGDASTAVVLRGDGDGIASDCTGVNMIGYVQSEMGVGESVRCAIKAARAIGLPVAIKSVDAPGPYRRRDRSVGSEHALCSHAVSIFHVNADQSELIVRDLGQRFLRDRCNIGFWAWELEDFPNRWLPSFAFFHEIWTPSSFCQSAIGRKALIPVIRMPHAIRLESSAPADRAGLGIPADATVFIAILDLLSIFERKNPLGVIAAFRHAFAASPKHCLVLKINHAAQRPAEMVRIKEAARGLPVTIIDRTINRSELTALIQMSDCLVSLHRSEGFGLTIAEAMFLCKPVLVTGYSGNLDFTKPDNAFLVDYDLVPVPTGCEPYDEGALWAEPLLDSAVAQMRLVATDSSMRNLRAQRGRDYIRAHFSPEAVGRLMKERLTLLSHRPSAAQPLIEAAAESRNPSDLTAAAAG